MGSERRRRGDHSQGPEGEKKKYRMGPMNLDSVRRRPIVALRHKFTGTKCHLESEPDEIT